MLGTFVLVIWFYHLGILNDSNALKDFVNQHSVCGPLVFILVQIFQVVFPVIPGGVTTVAGFLIFDPILAFFYNYVGIVIGSIILFILVRLYGRKFILLFVDENTKRSLILKIMKTSSSFACYHPFHQPISW